MRYIGIDLHRRFAVVALVDESGRSEAMVRLRCEDTTAIRQFFEGRRPFRAVVEASGSYRWLFTLIAPLGEIVLAHPSRLRAIVSGRAKTDELDARLLADLLRANLIPRAYVPPQRYHELRELTRARARLSRRTTQAKNEVHALLARANITSPFRVPFGSNGRRWLVALDLGPAANAMRDELLRRLDYFHTEAGRLDQLLEAMSHDFPEHTALLSLYGVARFTALLIVELGEAGRFQDGRAVGAYAGLTPRVRQSGEHSYHGRISRQGSPWLRWILVQVAMRLAPPGSRAGSLRPTCSEAVEPTDRARSRCQKGCDDLLGTPPPPRAAASSLTRHLSRCESLGGPLNGSDGLGAAVQRRKRVVVVSGRRGVEACPAR